MLNLGLSFTLLVGLETVTGSMNVFDEMGVYWAEIADKSQTEKQLQFLKNNLKSNGYVLDLACGTGRHLIPLSQQGFNMVGLDASANLLKIAKQRHKHVQLVKGDMRFLPFKPQAFAAAISMDTSSGIFPLRRMTGIVWLKCEEYCFSGAFLLSMFLTQKS